MSGLVFIVGAPRSGTTLLRAMVNRHPRFGLCDETFFDYWVAQRERAFGDLTDRARRAVAVDRYLATHRIQRLGLDVAALRETLLREGTSYSELFRALLQFAAQAQGKPRGGEKTPQHALIAAKLLAWYPDARLVHLVRDPRDVAASLKRMPWGGGHRLLDARLWRACVDGAEACRADPRFLRVRYESLIEAPQPELERLCAFLGEPFVPAMLEGAAKKTDRWWFDRAQGAVEKSRIERWRQELTATEIAQVEWVAGEALDRFGYAAAAPPLSAAGRAAARVGAALAGGRRQLRQLRASWIHRFTPTELAREEAAIDGPTDPAE